MNSILPGQTIGILGSGQLGRMLALEARRMGYRVHTFSPEKDSPTGQIADVEYIASYDDANAAKDFASSVDVVTLEFENISFDVAKAIESVKPIRPRPGVLHTTQHRLREKTFLKENGFPVTPFRPVTNENEIKTAFAELGTPCILKTAGFGYDGKGQTKVNSADEAINSFAKLGTSEAILETFISFEREISVVATRGLDGSFVPFIPVWNTHRNHILDVTIAPAPITEKLAKEAAEISRGIMEAFDCIGVLCVEFFVTSDQKLLVNELAPRPHNSGHWTIDACVTNQFEQQLRAVCNLPLGSPKMMTPFAAMVNILGDVWKNGEPHFAELLRDPNTKLHLYGKHDARAGRKMGHVNVIGSSAVEVSQKILRTKTILGIE
ncbi:MAG TPA: 5-(carboxyamino)imidazole ribonucleotide synthase [Candidatus Kapabacteria bacterium]|nr:5-(carboxyamino)imidazole ribonucleotide synthase [Candidatus Kapabacteria bacterium]